MDTRIPTRNTQFIKESMTKMSWTRVVSHKFPYDHATACCDKRAKVGEIVITIPVRRTGVVVGTAVVHSRCLLPFLDKIPQDMSYLVEKTARIVARFTKKEVA